MLGTRALIVAIAVALTSPLAAGIRGFAAADVNRDGKPDLIVWRPGDNGHLIISVMLNDGHGNFGSRIETDAGPGEDAIAGDVNGDAVPDVVVNSVVAGRSATLLGRGDGSFREPVAFPRGEFQSPFLADFDRDGHLDLIAVNSLGSHLRRGRGDGTFEEAVDVPIAAQVAAVADINNDGASDLITYTFQTTIVTLNDGHGNLKDQFPIIDDYTKFGAAGDFTGDGRADLLLFENGAAKVRPGNGDGTFAPERLTRLVPDALLTFEERGTSVTVADFDGDGRLDFATHGTAYLGNGDGTFRSRVKLTDTFMTDAAAADVDGNGSADLLFVDGDTVRVVRTGVDPVPSTHTSTTLTLDKSQAQYGEVVTLSAKVIGASTPADGVVRFSANGQPFALVQPDPSGVAVLSTGLPRGALTITATYTGDKASIESQASANITVTKVATVVHLDALQNPVAYPRHSLIYAIIHSSTGFEPTGEIVVREGSDVVGIVPANGKFLDLVLPPGVHTLTATYAGDANYDPGSATLVVRVIVPTTQKRAVRH